MTLTEVTEQKRRMERYEELTHALATLRQAEADLLDISGKLHEMRDVKKLTLELSSPLSNKHTGRREIGPFGLTDYDVRKAFLPLCQEKIKEVSEARDAV